MPSCRFLGRDQREPQSGEKLVRFLEACQVGLTNSRAVRSIRPFVIGPKDWLPHDAPTGATASAEIYSMIETLRKTG
jgi:transposase